MLTLITLTVDMSGASTVCQRLLGWQFEHKMRETTASELLNICWKGFIHVNVLHEIRKVFKRAVGCRGFQALLNPKLRAGTGFQEE